jgi:hypothetical protein
MVRKSECLEIAAPTEQGHPLSPELFKCYIHELSLALRFNNIWDINSPLLNRLNVTHLLWADDPVMPNFRKPSDQFVVFTEFSADRLK